MQKAANKVRCSGVFRSVALLSLVSLFFHFDPASASVVECADDLNESHVVSPESLESLLLAKTAAGIPLVPEFRFMRELGEGFGCRVWIFGGTAAAFLHHSKRDAHTGRFTDIFRSSQDIDIVIDGNPKLAQKFRKALVARYPYFLARRENKWEVRSLHVADGEPGNPGFKEALLNDFNFGHQNTDSQSVGLIEITQSSEPIIRDLKSWSGPSNQFLEDRIRGQIHFFRSPRHFETARAKIGENPEILSVVRTLVKAAQYDLQIPNEDFAEMKAIADAFDPKLIGNEFSERRLLATAKKIVLNAMDIEKALGTLEKLGLREKLLSLGDQTKLGMPAWWLSREPLRSKPIGVGEGRTAKEHGFDTVVHESKSFLAYESLVRAVPGGPNALVADGFLTLPLGAKMSGSGVSLFFKVDPNAREGTDFTLTAKGILFHNKKALQSVQEASLKSSEPSLEDLLTLSKNTKSFRDDNSDLALLEKVRLRLEAEKLERALNQLLESKLGGDLDRLIHFLRTNTKALPQELSETLRKNTLSRLELLSHSLKEEDVRRYLQHMSTLVEADATQIEGFSRYLEGIVASEMSLDLRREALVAKKGLRNPEIKTLAADIFSEGSQPKLNALWHRAIEEGNVQVLDLLVELGFFNLSYRNAGGFSLLLLADYYGHGSLVDWLISQPSYNFTAKNRFGFTDVEQLRLFGRRSVAEKIELKRPEAVGRKFATEEYGPKGGLLIDFIKVEKDEGIEAPFEISSIPVANRQWQIVLEIFKETFPAESLLLPEPSFLSASRHLAIDNISAEEVSLWLKALNRLSLSGDAQATQELRELFPGHQKGAIYRLLSESEGDYVARLGGLAESDHVYGSLKSDGDENRAIFWNGKPIYGFRNNFTEWRFSGDKISMQTYQRISGKSLLGLSSEKEPGFRQRKLGFRLARELPKSSREFP